MPRGHKLSGLNGINVGCGDRLISDYLLPVDVMRTPPLGKHVAGVHHALTERAMLTLPDELPFAAASIDLIVALHMLEHVEEPVAIINHWLDVLKPGGGIGLVLPDWRYTWDSRNDRAPFGHKWNPTPSLLRELHSRYWSSRSILEHLNTYDYKISFDVIIRKHGVFRPFSLPDQACYRSGRDRHELGIFLHGS